MSDVTVLMQFGLTLNLGVLFFVSAATGLKTCDTTKVFVTRITPLPTGNKPKTKSCDIVAGTNEPGYFQSFTGDIERCPKNISDCTSVGDAETQKSCRTCCAVNITIAGRPRSTKSTTTNPVLMTSASLTDSGWSKLTENFSMATRSSALKTSSLLTTRTTQSRGNSASVTPSISRPITKCGIIPGTKKQGFPQSFADDLQACPKNILDCVAVGDAEAQRNCQTCCTRSPTKTQTTEVINYTLITPTQTIRHSVFVTSTTSTTSNKTNETRCGHIPETNKRVFYQPFVENIVLCPKITSNCKTVGDEETQKNCLKCCTANSGSDRRDEKNNHMTTILSGVFGTIGFAFVILGVFVYKKRWLRRVNILSTQNGRKPLAFQSSETNVTESPDDSGQPNERQVLLEESQNFTE